MNKHKKDCPHENCIEDGLKVHQCLCNCSTPAPIPWGTEPIPASIEGWAEKMADLIDLARKEIEAAEKRGYEEREESPERTYHD